MAPPAFAHSFPNRSALRLCTLALALALGAPGQAQTDAPARGPTTAGLPNLGDGSSMTPGAERRLGNRIVREMYKDPDYIDDPVLTDYVQGIFQPLLAASRARGELQPELDAAYAWEILMIRDRTVNAFALPGAYFGLYLGLLGLVANKDELASVLAHEMSHVTQRHISRVMARQAAQAPWLMGAMFLGMLAAGKNPDGASAVLVGGQAVAAQTQLNFSRDMEREADRIGFGVMSQAGFEPMGFVTMFGKLQQASRLNDSGNFPYLRSHPLSTERIADMLARVPQANSAATAGVAATAVVQEMDHAMVTARARLLSDMAIDSLRSWGAQVEPARIQAMPRAPAAGALYGATLAAIKMREFDNAQALWVRLNRLVAQDPAALRQARWLGAELALARGQAAQALDLLQPDLAKPNRVALLLLAQAWLETSQAAKAGEALQVWVSEHPRDAQAWTALSRAQAAQGRMLASIRDEAEASLAQEDYAGAMSRLKAAQDIARRGVQGADHIEASIVDTRARYVESLLKEELLER